MGAVRTSSATYLFLFDNGKDEGLWGLREMTIDVAARAGSEFSSAEHQNFIDFVLLGGEVPEATLRRNVPVAPRLVFLREGGQLHGVAALKTPIGTYRAAIRQKAGINVDSDEYPFELGYVFVDPRTRGRGYAKVLVDAALGASDGSGVFATSREDNVAMHRTLLGNGFTRAGEPYQSREAQQRRLQLFLRAGKSN